MRDHARADKQGAERNSARSAPTPGRESRAQRLDSGDAQAKSDTLFKGTPWPAFTEADLPEAQEIAQGIEEAGNAEIAEAQQAPEEAHAVDGEDSEDKAEAAEAKKPAQPDAEAEEGEAEEVVAAKPEEKPSPDDGGADDGGPPSSGGGGDADSEEDGDEAEDADDAGDDAGADLPGAPGMAAAAGARADEGDDAHEVADGPDVGAQTLAEGGDVGASDPAAGQRATDAAVDEDVQHEAGFQDADAKSDHFAQVDEAMQPDGGGQPLAAGTRERMEDATGIDLGDVRLHAGGAQAEILTSLGGKAAAKGRHILLAHGFNPDSAEGHDILEHEMHHVAQFSEGRVGNIASAAGNGDRAALEGDAEKRAADRKVRGNTARKNKQRVPLPNAGPALFFGIPNPIEVAKDVGGAVVSGAKKVGSTVVGAGKSAVKFVKKTAGKVVSFVRDAVSKVIGWVRDAVRGVMSALRNLDKIVDWLRAIPVVGKAIGGAVDAVRKAAKAAASAYKAAKRKAKQLVAGARRLASYTAKIAKRGPAYFEAARAAAANVVRGGINAAGNVYERGKDAVNAALREVYKQGKRAFDASAHALRVAYKGLKTATKAVGRGIKAAAKWVKKNADKIKAVGNLVLDVATMMPPPVGPIAAVTKAGIAIAGGNWKDAGVELLGAIPGFAVAAKAGKYGAKGTALAMKTQAVFTKLHKVSKTGATNARKRIKLANKRIKDIAERNRDKIDRFKDQLGDRFDTLEARYRDFKPRVREFISEKREHLSGFRKQLQDSMEKYREQRDMIEQAKGFYDNAKTIKEDIDAIKEAWGSEAPQAPPVNEMAPSVAGA